MKWYTSVYVFTVYCYTTNSNPFQVVNLWTSQHRILILQIGICPFIIAVDILPTTCLHINTPYDCAIQGRGAEVPNHQCHCPGFRRGDISCDSAEEGGWKNCRDLSLSLSLLHFTFDYCVVRVWGEMGSRLRSWADCDNADPGTTLGTTITHFTPPGPGVAQCQQ